MTVRYAYLTETAFDAGTGIIPAFRGQSIAKAMPAFFRNIGAERVIDQFEMEYRF